MTYQFCQVECAEAITLITIDRPEVLNALHGPAHVELDRIFAAFAADAAQQIAIITGSGQRAFCAGYDLKHHAAGEAVQFPPSGFGGLTSRYDLLKPVIAAVNGLALGGGFEIALACDLVIASEQARFALREPRLGFVALGGGLRRLPRQIGLKCAMGMILTGRDVSAQEGYQAGFINEVVRSEDLIRTARTWASWILECSPLAVRASKQMVMQREYELDRALALQSYSALERLRASPDPVAGVRGFATKRRPEWDGE